MGGWTSPRPPTAGQGWTPSGRGAGAPDPLPPGGSHLPPDLVQEIVAGGMGHHVLELGAGDVPHVLPVADADGPPLLHDRLDVAHDLPPGFQVQGLFRLPQLLGELLVHPAGLVPGNRLALFVRDVGQGQHHDAQGTVGPGGDAQVHLGPPIPVAAGFGDVQGDVEAGRLGQLLQGLGDLRFGLVVLGGQGHPQGQLDALLRRVLLQQGPGALRIVGGDGLFTVLGVHRGDMGVDAQQPLAEVGELEDPLPVLTFLQRGADPVVVPGLQVHPHPQHEGLRGAHGVDGDARHVLQGQVVAGPGLVDAVDLAGLDRGHGRVLVDGDVDDLVQVGQGLAVLPELPVVRPGLEHGPLALRVLLQGEGAGAHGLFDEIPLEGPGEDHRGVVEEVFGHRDVGRLQVEADGVVIHLLHVLHAAPVGDEPQHGGAHIRIQPLADGEDHVVRGELLSVVEPNALAQVEGPGLDIVAGLPAFQQVGPGDVVRPGEGQVLGHLAHHIGRHHPGHAGRVVDALELHGLAQGAPTLDRGRRGLLGRRGGTAPFGRRSLLLGRGGGLGTRGQGRGGGHRGPQQGRVAHELPPGDPPPTKLVLGLVDQGMDAGCGRGHGTLSFAVDGKRARNGR